MTLRIKCTCGKKLAIPEAHAGKRLACPQCKRAFRVSPEKFRAAVPSAPAVATPAVPAGLDEPAELDLQPAALDGGDLLGALANDEASARAAAPPPSVVIVDDTVNMEYAAGERGPS